MVNEYLLIEADSVTGEESIVGCVPEPEFGPMLLRQQDAPEPVGMLGESHLWLFRGAFYRADRRLGAAEMRRRALRGVRESGHPFMRRGPTHHPPLDKAASKTPAIARQPDSPRDEGTQAPCRRDLTRRPDKTALQHDTALKEVGARRKAAEQEHKDAVEAMHKAATAALDAGIPMSIVASTLGVSRQWIYRMGNYADRSNVERH